MAPSIRVEQSIARARALQSELNIFIFIEDAEDVAGASGGPLHDVPIALKDLIDHAGRTTTCGSAFYRHEAERSATVVARLESAGARIMGRTGLHEFAFGFSSENPHFGPVRNPWDAATSAGGSSGGSGAAVAAGIVPIAIGTDTGGSVRVPAALCGCFGLKVSYGAIPIDGVFPLVPTIDTVGLLADSASNLEMAYRAMSLDEKELPAARTYRLGIPQPWVEDAPMADEVAAGFAELIDALRGAGHEVHPINIPDLLPDARLGYAIGIEAAPIHRDFRRQNLPYGADVARRLDAAESVTDEQATSGALWQQMIRQRFDDAFSVVDLLITPTVPAMKKRIGEDFIGSTHYRSVLSWFTAVVNHALIPALALPSAATGTPSVSLQVIGPVGSDLRLISLARSLESAGIVGFEAAPVSSEPGSPKSRRG